MIKKIIQAIICGSVIAGSLAMPAHEKVEAAVTVREISANDVDKIKKSIMGINSLTDDEKKIYDLNNDSKINIIDLSVAKDIVIYDKKPFPPKTAMLNVNMVMQNPELPTGCEVTALTMLMNYNGFVVSKTTLADIMPKMNFYYYNGSLYGADFLTTFPGNPYSSSGSYGCYTPCMVTTAQRYLNTIGNTTHRLVDITGTEFEELLDQVAMGRPVMAWATMGLVESALTTKWTTPEGKNVQWRNKEHCLLITGYDKNEGIVYVNDPLEGKITYPISQFKLRYDQMGKYAAIMLKDSETHEPPSTTPSTGKVHKVGDIVKYTGEVYYSSYGGKTVYISGTYTITQIVEDETRPYRILLDNQGWVAYDAV